MIISIKSIAKGGSSRGLVHYLAHSKFDRTKEEIDKREFFSESENGLDVRLANQKLGISGKKPKAEEILHLVISPSKEEIAQVGKDLKSRKAALQSIVRETVAALKMKLNIRKLKWVSVAHFNTGNPHAHLALQKEFINKEGQTKSLRITRQMLHYNEKNENGEKTLHKGILILAAEKKLKEIAAERENLQENTIINDGVKVTEKSGNAPQNSTVTRVTDPLKPTAYSERRILAEEMLVFAEMSRRNHNIENLIEHGDKKRFKIKDEETGKNLHVSLFDIERKITLISRRKSRALHPKNFAKRTAAASLIAETERTKHSPVIHQLETIRRHILGFENRHLSEAEGKYTRLNNQKLLIEKKYQKLKMDVPLPLFTSDEIQFLQTEALRGQNIEKLLSLENIRQKNAQEANQPSRRTEDVQKLLGAKIVAELKLEAAEQRLTNFPRSKDFVKVKIGDSFWSHDSLEQHKNQSSRQNGFWTQLKDNTFALVFPSRKKNSANQGLDYPVLKFQISEALGNLEKVQVQKLENQKKIAETLDQIFQADTNPNKSNLLPVFSPFELSEMEDLTQFGGGVDFYEKSLLWQEDFLREKLPRTNTKSPTKNSEMSVKKELSEVQSGQVEKIIGKFLSGRAAARNIIAKMKVAQIRENIHRFHRDKIFVKHRLKDEKTGAEREVSVWDVEHKKPYFLIDKFLWQITESQEQKNERRLVHQASNNKEKELVLDLETHQTQLSQLEKQLDKIREKYEIGKEVSPLFTPKEIAFLEARKQRTSDKSHAEELAKIISDAEKEMHVERIQDLLKNAAKELESITTNFSKVPEPGKSSLDQDKQPIIKAQEKASPGSAKDFNVPPAQDQFKVEAKEQAKPISRGKQLSR